MTMVKLGRFALMAVLMAATSACSKDSTGPDGGSGGGIVGTWDLVSIDGDNVPVVESDGSCTYTIKSAFFKFNSNGTYSSSASTTEACVGEGTFNDTETDSGDYDLDGNDLTLSSDLEGEITFQIQLSGSTLKFDDGDGALIVFKRR